MVKSVSLSRLRSRVRVPFFSNSLVYLGLMRSSLCADLFKRKSVENNQVARKLIRLLGYLDSTVFINLAVSNYQRYWSMSGYSCSLKVRKRCFVSGRRRGVSIFGLSRHDLRNQINVGSVSGLFRVTW